jgi:hypothetical protein
MAKRKGRPRGPVEKVPERPADNQPDEDPGRTEDRHSARFMTRLPDVYRRQLRKLQDLYQEKHRFRPDMTELIQKAIEDLLAGFGLWPPQGSGPAESM